MIIKFSTLTGKIILIDTEASHINTLRKLRLYLSNQTEIPLEELCIVYGGKPLNHQQLDEDAPLLTLQIPNYERIGREPASIPFSSLNILEVLHVIQKVEKKCSSASIEFSQPQIQNRFFDEKQSDNDDKKQFDNDKEWANQCLIS